MTTRETFGLGTKDELVAKLMRVLRDEEREFNGVRVVRHSALSSKKER